MGNRLTVRSGAFVASLLFVLALADKPAAAAPPVVAANAAMELGFTTVRAHGLVDPGAQEAFYRFEYIADSLYRRDAAEGRKPFATAIADGSGWLPAGAGAVPLAPLLGEFGGLEAGVEYHLRLVAENEDGAAVAVAPSFTTPEPLEPIPCFGDNCQVLPPEPRDPTLGTTVPGLGNPKVHYTHYGSKRKGRRHQRGHHKKKSGKRNTGKGGR